MHQAMNHCMIFTLSVNSNSPIEVFTRPFGQYSIPIYLLLFRSQSFNYLFIIKNVGLMPSIVIEGPEKTQHTNE